MTNCVQISSGVTLTIQPGTKLEFDPGTYMAVAGKLVGSGFGAGLTAGKTGTWSGIRVGGSGGVSISGSTIVGATGTFLDVGGSGSPILNLSKDTLSHMQGIAVQAKPGSRLTVKGTSIVYASGSAGNSGVGISASGSFVDLENNTIEYASVTGVSVTNPSGGPGGSPLISLNTIEHNGTNGSGGDGLILQNVTGTATAKIHNNLIEDNGPAGSTSFAGLRLSSAPSTSLYCNQIENNSVGVIVDAGTGSIQSSDLFGDTSKDAIASTGAGLTAEFNYWGQATGARPNQTSGTVDTGQPLTSDIGAYQTCKPPAPTVSTGAATNVSATTAVLHGQISPRGTDTSVSFLWGTTTTYGHTTPSQDIGSGMATTPAKATLTGLLPGVTYHYATQGTNSSGTSTGSDRTFETCSSPPGMDDDFSCAAILPKWNVYRGSATSTIEPLSPGLSITAAPNSSLGSRNEPRLTQTVQGDFTLRVHVETPDGFLGSSTQGAGLLVRQDDQNYVYVARTPSGIEFGGSTNGVQSTFGSDAVSSDATLELLRTGNTYTASFRPDGDEWRSLGSAHVPLVDFDTNGAPLLGAGLTVFDADPSNSATANFSAFQTLGGSAGRWSLAGSLNRARADATFTTLTNGDVLAIGGDSRQSELFDPDSQTWKLSGTMASERHDPTTVAMSNGDVLVAGGYDASGNPLASVEEYVTATGTFKTMAPMVAARSNASGVLLSDGTVLVAGGDGTTGPLASAEIFHPSPGTSGSWTTTGAMQTRRDNFALVSLPSTKVLAAGGETLASGTAGVTATAERFDPSTGNWSAAGALSVARSGPAFGLLPNGQVIVAGGADGHGHAMATADLYNPATNVWTRGRSMLKPQASAAFTTLTNGQLFVAGGYNSSGRLDVTERYSSSSGTWQIGFPLHDARYGAGATLLSTSQVVLAGGVGVNGFLGSTEIWNSPATATAPTGTWTALAGTSCQAPGNCLGADDASVVLPDGRILVAGGCCDASGNSQTLAGLYTPGTNSWQWSNMNFGRESFTLTYLPASKTVLAVGGFAQGANGTTFRSSSEIFDPSSNSWTETQQTMSTARAAAPAVLLNAGPNAGDVLVAGGTNNQGSQSTTELFDPTASGTTSNPVLGTWTSGASMPVASEDQTMTTVLAGGDRNDVAVIGGLSGTGASLSEISSPGSPRTDGPRNDTSPSDATPPRAPVPSYQYLNAVQIYNPTTGLWKLMSQHLPVSRAFQSATALPNGEILVAGGYNAAIGYLNNCSLLTPVGGTWTSCGNLTTPRASAGALLLPGGKVLIAGGQNDAQIYLDSTEIYDPSTNSWTTGSPFPTARADSILAPTTDGAILVGGRNDGGSVSEVDALKASASTHAVHFSVTVPYYTPSTASVGIAGPFDGEEASNLPLVRVDATHFQGGVILPTGASTQYNYVLLRETGSITESSGGSSCSVSRTAAASGPASNYYDSLAGWCGIRPGNAVAVTFKASLPSSTPASSPICLAADTLNALNTSNTRLTRTGLTAMGTYVFQKGSVVKYYYTRCSTAIVEATSGGTPRSSSPRSLTVGAGPTQLRSDTVAAWHS